MLTLALAFPRVFTPRLEDGQSPRLWLAALASISYASNWVRAFDLTEMSFLQHTWSLGIEEQFYTLWPLALLALLGTRNRRFWTIVVVCAGIVGSAALRAVTWQGRESLLRDYYSLETRLGRISYGVYLWHSPIQTGVLGEARLLRLGVPSALRVVLPFLATIAVAAASFYLLEQPILRANARRHERIAAAQTLRRGTAN